MVQLEDKTYQEILKASREQTAEILLLKAEVQWLKEPRSTAGAKKRLYGSSSEQSPVGQEVMLPYGPRLARRK